MLRHQLHANLFIVSFSCFCVWQTVLIVYCSGLVQYFSVGVHLAHSADTGSASLDTDRVPEHQVRNDDLLMKIEIVPFLLCFLYVFIYDVHFLGTSCRRPRAYPRVSADQQSGIPERESGHNQRG